MLWESANNAKLWFCEAPESFGIEESYEECEDEGLVEVVSIRVIPKGELK